MNLRTEDEPVLSLRTWIEAIDQLGELSQVKGAHWDLEIGTIAELNYRRTDPPALLFDEFPGYASGQRVLVGSTGSPARLGHTLRMGAHLSGTELVGSLGGMPSRWAAAAADYPAQYVAHAPFHANHIPGDQVDLLELPVPRWHHKDGGRFIGTGCFVVTSDPETGAINGGCYRMQVVDGGRTATINAVPGKHGAQNIARWFDKHGRAPVTVSFGHDPVLLVTGGTEVPSGISEIDYAGAIVGERVPVVAGQDTGLPIPAASEVVLEGWLTPEFVFDEGPFGEWTGYYSASRRPVPALDITHMFHRDDPIQLGAPPGKPPHDYSYMRTVMKSAMIQDELVNMGLAGVRGAWAHEAGGGRLFVVVSLAQRYAGHSRQAAHLAAHCPAAAYMNRFVVVVDEDVDPTNLDHVLWALCTRSDPASDIDVISHTWGSKLDPMLPEGAVPHNSRAVIDACVPFGRRHDFPAVSESPPQYAKEVEQKWSHLFES